MNKETLVVNPIQALPGSLTEVPVIDFTPFRGGTSAGKAAVAAAIRGACETIGFFYLSGHGIAQSRIDAVFAASMRFFALPLFCPCRGQPWQRR